LAAVLALIAIAIVSATVTSAAAVRASTATAATATAAAGPVPKGFLGASLSFISADDGWVLGTAPCAEAPCTSLLHTLNGGRTWTGIPAPRAAIGTGADDDVSGVRFENASIGFAFGPGLWVTRNGGTKWTQQRSVAGMRTFDVLSLAATSNDTVYALVAQANPTTGGSVGANVLVRAAPHSTSFSAVAEVPPGSGQGVVAAGSSAYVVTGDNRVRSFGPVGEHTYPTPGVHNLDTGCALAASSSTALLADCGSSVSSGAMGQRTEYGSTDGGRRWIRLPNPGAGDGYATEGLAETANGHAVIVTGDGGDSGLLSTVNGGRSWRLTLSFANDGAPFRDLGFENDQDGSVIYDPVSGVRGQTGPVGVLYRTSNGGASWHRVAY
jgi:photosystem II stability/assembly factor-like uncharacterized protein